MPTCSYFPRTPSSPRWPWRYQRAPRRCRTRVYLQKFHHVHPLPLPPQHVGVPPLPVLQRIKPADHHHHRWEPLLREPYVVLRHVRRRVVPRGPRRQERAPPEVGAAEAHDRRHAVQRQLRLRPLLAAEVGLHGQQARHPELPPRGLVVVVLVGGGPGPGLAVGHVVDYVAPGALPGQEAVGEV